MTPHDALLAARRSARQLRMGWTALDQAELEHFTDEVWRVRTDRRQMLRVLKRWLLLKNHKQGEAHD